MFYYIKGKLVLNEISQVVIDVGGVAYSMTVSANTQAAVSSKSFNGENEVTLFTHLSVREDGIELFGFHDHAELDMFKLLISVSGIGPKAAMSILSHMTPDAIAYAIFSDDKKTISKAPGVGSKTAQRIILDLKDKVKAEDILDGFTEPVSGHTEGSDVGAIGKEAIEALTALGYSASEASGVVKKVTITESMTAEDVLKAALKHLAFL